MDYEKKYKEALLSIRQRVESGLIEQCYVEDAFPELRESEESKDEKVRKAIYNCVKWFGFDSCFFKDVSQEECLAWFVKQGEHANFRNKIQIGDKVTRNEDGVLVNLSQLNRVAKKDEKQGEQKPTNTVEPRFKINDKVIHKETGKTWTIHWYLADTNSYYVTDEEGLINHYSEDVLESAKQKPAEWSEEDNIILSRIIADYERSNEEWFNAQKSLPHGRKITWLKTIKDRIQHQTSWKPSKEQLDGLKEAIEFLGCTKTRREQLQSLYDELKN